MSRVAMVGSPRRCSSTCDSRDSRAPAPNETMMWVSNHSENFSISSSVLDTSSSRSAAVAGSGSAARNASISRWSRSSSGSSVRRMTPRTYRSPASDARRLRSSSTGTCGGASVTPSDAASASVADPPGTRAEARRLMLRLRYAYPPNTPLMSAVESGTSSISSRRIKPVVTIALRIARSLDSCAIEKLSGR